MSIRQLTLQSLLFVDSEKSTLRKPTSRVPGLSPVAGGFLARLWEPRSKDTAGEEDVRERPSFRFKGRCTFRL